MKKNILIITVAIIAAFTGFTQNADASGELDHSFGSNGKITYQVDELQGMKRIAEQSDGKILVAGYKQYLNGYRLILRRHHASGLHDLTFGKNGEASDGSTFGNSYIYGSEPSEIAVQPDGAILIAGKRYNSKTGNFLGYSLWRFTSGGKLDTTFGGGGKIDLGGFVFAIKLMSVKKLKSYETKILVLHSIANGLLSRFNLDGSVDNGFGTQGALAISNKHLLETTRGDFFNGDFIYVAGGDHYSRQISRYRANGTPDSSFGSGGTAEVSSCDISNIIERIVQIEAQRDGKILFLQSTPNNTPLAQLSRLTLNGECDSEFPGLNLSGIATGMAVQSDGKIIVGGAWAYNSGTYFGTRVFMNGEVDASYQMAESVGSFIVVNSTNKIISLKQSGDSYTLLRLLP